MHVRYVVLSAPALVIVSAACIAGRAAFVERASLELNAEKLEQQEVSMPRGPEFGTYVEASVPGVDEAVEEVVAWAAASPGLRSEDSAEEAPLLGISALGGGRPGGGGWAIGLPHGSGASMAGGLRAGGVSVAPLATSGGGGGCGGGGGGGSGGSAGGFDLDAALEPVTPLEPEAPLELETSLDELIESAAVIHEIAEPGENIAGAGPVAPGLEAGAAAPSHDEHGTPVPIPLPNAALLAGVGLMVVGWRSRRL